MNLHERDDVKILFPLHIFQVGDVLEEIGVQILVVKCVIWLHEVSEFLDYQLVAIFLQHLFCYGSDVFCRKGRYTYNNFFLRCKGNCRNEQCCEYCCDNYFFHNTSSSIFVFSIKKGPNPENGSGPDFHTELLSAGLIRRGSVPVAHHHVADCKYLNSVVHCVSSFSC